MHRKFYSKIPSTIYGLLVRGTSELSSWSMAAMLLAFSSPRFPPTIIRGLRSASHNVLYLSFLIKRTGRHSPPAERSACLHTSPGTDTIHIIPGTQKKNHGIFLFLIASVVFALFLSPSPSLMVTHIRSH